MLHQNKKFFLTNSMTGKREEFKPAAPPKVSYYSCGPTVYGPLHIGNARALIYADLLFRWLKHIGYDVNFVRNYTDVDDKIIDRANKEHVDSFEVSERYIEYCETDIRLLGLQPPTHTVKVRDSIEDIIKITQKIIERGHAYVVDGEVLFSIESFPGYGKLSGKNPDDLLAGARVAVDSKKRNPMDFSLWKPAKPGEPSWDSPWGKGRPGWHIECSAMVTRWLGESIDIHHGGQDLIFPHHENEIAQSESASGKEFCRYWVHHAFLTSGNEKMSKSLGNILTIRDFIDQYGAEVLRFMYVSFHYRSGVPYTEETMTQLLGELERVYLTKKWALEASQAQISHEAKGAPWSPLLGKARELFGNMEDELFVDLNTPGALGHLFSFIREINRVEAQAAGRPGVPAPSSAERREVALEFVALLDKLIHPILNVFGEEPSKVLEQIEKIRRKRQKTHLGDDEIRRLIDERNQARRNKDFRRSDEIRAQLDAEGIVLVDSPQGTTWKAKS